MKSDETRLTFITDTDKELLERVGLATLLEDEEFLKYTGELVWAFQSRHGSAPLSAIIELISAAIRYEPRVVHFVTMTDLGQKEKNRVLSIFSLAAIEQLTKMEYVIRTPRVLLSYLSKDEALAFSRLPSEKQHFLVAAFEDLTSLDLSFLDAEEKNRIDESLQNFSAGYILDDKSRIQNAIILIYRSLETKSRKSLLKIVETYFQGNFRRAQAELSLPHKGEIWKFTLGECYQSFENWNHSTYKNFFTLPKHFLRSLRIVIDVRNSLVHGMPRWTELGVTTRDVEEAMLKGLNSLIWLYKNILCKELTKVSVGNASETAASILEKHKKTGEKLDEILDETLKTQKTATETRNLLTLLFTDFRETQTLLMNTADKIKKSQGPDIDQVLEKLTAAVSQNNNEVLRKATETIIDNQDEIIKTTKKRKQGITTFLIRFARSSVQYVPSEILGNLISHIIINLDPKYLPNMIQLLSKTLSDFTLEI